MKCDYYTYLTKYNKNALVDYPKIGLGKLMKMLKPEEKIPTRSGDSKNSGPLWLTTVQEKIVNSIHANVVCQVDKKTSVITISVKDQDPLVAALMADSVKSHLQVAITEYRTKKARVDLDYMQKIYNEARSQYDKSRQLYASYADANQDVILQSFKMKQDDLENDMQLKYNIYTQVVEQLQLAKAKVQERTPAFTIVQSATVPIKACSRSRASVVIIFMMLGFVLRSLILMLKNKKQLIN